MTHGDDFWRAVVDQNNIEKFLLSNSHHPTCEFLLNQKLLLKNYPLIWKENKKSGLKMNMEQ